IPDVDPIIEKLTDTSLYTGTHKQRFDPETGVGRGLEGRDTVATTASLANIVSRHNPNKTLGGPLVTPPKTPSSSNIADDASNSSTSPTPGHGSGSSVFDRLTSVSSFTGSHKHRFNADGTGKGKMGRTGDGAGEIVADLSQIVRK
ncbi:hypothetical protein HDU76_005421, partial [Blyttiomyces sp. JEL0837]